VPTEGSIARAACQSARKPAAGFQWSLSRRLPTALFSWRGSDCKGRQLLQVRRFSGHLWEAYSTLRVPQGWVAIITHPQIRPAPPIPRGHGNDVTLFGIVGHEIGPGNGAGLSRDPQRAAVHDRRLAVVAVLNPVDTEEHFVDTTLHQQILAVNPLVEEVAIQITKGRLRIETRTELRLRVETVTAHNSRDTA